MKGVVIQGMEMPKKCEYCRFISFASLRCTLSRTYVKDAYSEGRQDEDCPLREYDDKAEDDRK